VFSILLIVIGISAKEEKENTRYHTIYIHSNQCRTMPLRFSLVPDRCSTAISSKV